MNNSGFRYLSTNGYVSSSFVLFFSLFIIQDILLSYIANQNPIHIPRGCLPGPPGSAQPIK
jgi:hypothetical protein